MTNLGVPINFKVFAAEEEAAYYAGALVGKFLQNRRKNGIHIDGVLTVWEPPKEDT